MAIDLAVMRRRLEEKQAEIQQHIATLTGCRAPHEDAMQGSDGVEEPEEEGVDIQETDVEQGILDSEKTLLAEVQQALVRIENGTYGICSNCGQPIPEKRLEAIPWATLCVTCESKLGAEGWERGLLNSYRMRRNQTHSLAAAPRNAPTCTLPT